MVQYLISYIGSIRVFYNSHCRIFIGEWCWLDSVFVVSTIILILVFDQKPTKPYCTSDLPEFAHKTLSLVTGRPFLTSSALRLIPVVPSCACVLICLELNISKANICAGTIAFGWLRPVLLAIIGSHIPTIADLLLKVT